MFSVAIRLGAPGTHEQYKPIPVSRELRGYTESGSQLRLGSTAGKMVSITAVSARFCPTGRDLYLEKNLKVDTPSWERAVLGKVVDSLLVELHRLGMEHVEDAFESAIKTKSDVNLVGLHDAIVASAEQYARSAIADWIYEGSEPSLKGCSIETFADFLSGGEGTGSPLIESTSAALVDLVRYETRLLIEYIRRARRWRWLSRSNAWMSEVRATLLRLQTGIKLDPNENHARQFGLNPEIKPDFVYAITLVGDLKAGKYHSFYASVATGYAIYAEAILHRRINGAAILSLELDSQAGRLIKHEVHLVEPDDDARQLWVTHRDFALEIIRAPQAPPHPTDLTRCPGCPYRPNCWTGGVPGTNPVTPAAPTPPPKQSGKKGAAKQASPAAAAAPTGLTATQIPDAATADSSVAESGTDP